MPSLYDQFSLTRDAFFLNPIKYLPATQSYINLGQQYLPSLYPIILYLDKSPKIGISNKSTGDSNNDDHDRHHNDQVPQQNKLLTSYIRKLLGDSDPECEIDFSQPIGMTYHQRKAYLYDIKSWLTSSIEIDATPVSEYVDFHLMPLEQKFGEALFTLAIVTQNLALITWLFDPRPVYEGGLSWDERIIHAQRCIDEVGSEIKDNNIAQELFGLINLDRTGEELASSRLFRLCLELSPRHWKIVSGGQHYQACVVPHEFLEFLAQPDADERQHHAIQANFQQYSIFNHSIRTIKATIDVGIPFNSETDWLHLPKPFQIEAQLGLLRACSRFNDIEMFEYGVGLMGGRESFLQCSPTDPIFSPLAVDKILSSALNNTIRNHAIDILECLIKMGLNTTTLTDQPAKTLNNCVQGRNGNMNHRLAGEFATRTTTMLLTTFPSLSQFIITQAKTETDQPEALIINTALMTTSPTLEAFYNHHPTIAQSLDLSPLALTQYFTKLITGSNPAWSFRFLLTLPQFHSAIKSPYELVCCTLRSSAILFKTIFPLSPTQIQSLFLNSSSGPTPTNPVVVIPIHIPLIFLILLSWSPPSSLQKIFESDHYSSMTNFWNTISFDFPPSSVQLPPPETNPGILADMTSPQQLQAQPMKGLTLIHFATMLDIHQFLAVTTPMTLVTIIEGFIESLCSLSDQDLETLRVNAIDVRCGVNLDHIENYQK